MRYCAPPIHAVFSVLIGVIISLTALTFSFSKHEQTKFQELAFVDGTSSFFASYNGFQIHCNDVDDAKKCEDGFKKRGLSNAVLWLGNSQVHAINQYQVGQKSMAEVLFHKLKDHDLDLLTFSQPNASLQEHYVLFEYFKRHLPLRFFLLPVVFDDTRETGIRPSIAKSFEDNVVSNELKQTDIGKSILEANQGQSEKDSDLAGVVNTTQEWSERVLNEFLKKNVSLWELRPEIRGRIFVGMYKLRNWIFGINPGTKRPKILGRYNLNMLALKALLQSARDDHINVLLYVVPIRQDVEIPYIAEEYSQFKNEVSLMAKNAGAFFVNLEDLVPAHLWGQKESTTIGRSNLELDYMHFQEKGHYLLARDLYKNIIHIVRDEK